MENKESYFSASDEVDPTQPQPIVRLTSTEPYPGPGLIESATQLVKNWVRQGYNDLIAAGEEDGKAGPAVTAEAAPPDPSAEYDAIPPTEQVCTVLGRQYCAIRDRDELLKDLESRLWFTYRRGFPPIGGTGPTSDTGWGCMLRCGQMMLAEALLVRHLGRDWRWEKNSSNRGGAYEGILKLFQDRKDALYSIHQIAQMGQSEGKPVGSWFGPNTVAQVLRRLSLYDDWSSLCVYVAMDNTVVVEDIEKLCSQPIPHPATSTMNDETADVDDTTDIDSPLPSLSSVIVGKDLISSAHLRSFFPSDSSSSTSWNPLLLVIPLRLGLSDINPMYVEPLKACLSLPQSVGIIGGTPNHAHYFVGHVGDSLFFLDPHTTQCFVDLDEVAAFWDAEENTKTMEEEEEEETNRRETSRKTNVDDASITNEPSPAATSSSAKKPKLLRGDETYHSPLPDRMKILDLDPSIAVGFFCRNQDEFRALVRDFQRLILRVDDEEEAEKRRLQQPMFEVSQRHPPHWPPFDPYPEASPTSMKGAAASMAEFMLVETDRHYDTDEEFELL